MDWREVLTAISPALQTLLVALVTALVPVVGLYIRRLALCTEAKLRASMSAAEWNLALTIAAPFVSAAEELFESGDGPAKLDYVKAMVMTQLQQYGIKLDLDALEGIIHSLVWEEFNRWKKERENLVFTDPTFQGEVTIASPSPTNI